MIAGDFCIWLKSGEFHIIYIVSGIEAVASREDSVGHKIWHLQNGIW